MRRERALLHLNLVEGASIAGVETTSSRPAATIKIGWRILTAYELSANAFI